VNTANPAAFDSVVVACSVSVASFRHFITFQNIAMNRQSAYDQSREFLAAAYKSLSEPKKEHAQTCHKCNGSGFDPIKPPNQFKVCETCKGCGYVIVMR